jgi:hypothetical protein
MTYGLLYKKECSNTCNIQQNVTLRTCHKSPPHHFHTPFIAREIESRWHLECSLTSGGNFFTKGRVSREWVDVMDWHYKNEGLKLIGTECVTKLSMALWYNLHHIWTYRNTRFHEKDNETIARYKREEMDRPIHTIWEK